MDLQNITAKPAEQEAPAGRGGDGALPVFVEMVRDARDTEQARDIVQPLNPKRIRPKVKANGETATDKNGNPRYEPSEVEWVTAQLRRAADHLDCGLKVKTFPPDENGKVIVQFRAPKEKVKGRGRKPANGNGASAPASTQSDKPAKAGKSRS